MKLGKLLSCPRSQETAYQGNNLQRITKITAPDPDDTGSLSAPETTYSYGRGRLDKITDPLGRETTIRYDGFGRAGIDVFPVEDRPVRRTTPFALLRDVP